ncbi:MAG: AAA family ATPase [Polyangiaceae bacterium]
MSALWWVNERQLNSEQKEVIRLSTDGHHLIEGPPGSGKTNLLLLRAKFLIRSKIPHIALLTFTRALRQFLVRGATQYAIPANRLMTVLEWSKSQLTDLGGSLADLPDTFPEMREEVARRLAQRIRSSGASGTFDSILVDEAQDLTPKEIANLLRLGKTIFAVGDAGQRIYDVDGALSRLRGHCTLTKLTSHYRCAPEICSVADEIASSTAGIAPILPDCNYSDPDEANIERIQVTTLLDQCDKLLGKVEVQLRAYPDELIAVACPLVPQVEEVRAFLLRSPLSSQVFPGDDTLEGAKSNRVLVTTLHKLKGLEFKAVNLVGLEEISALRQAQKRVGYMAVTRARTSLVAYWSPKSTGRSIPGWLEKGLVVNDQPHDASLAELFGDDPLGGAE